jgi:DNA-binding helix-hairpin-helix protein with protein kinase domain/Flp pilus assembly protein TadD
MLNRINSQIYDSQGRPVFLDGELRRGGEGAVYDVKGHGNLVAKLYHKAIDQQKAVKLAAMVKLRTDRLLKLTAWPVETLHEQSGGTIKGFLMPKVVNHKEIHVLYGVKSRLSDYPQARWPFLIQTAANVARAFSVVHEHGQVIGDVNHGGIFVSNQATVMLVDCDSFQVVAQGQQFLCEVGIDTHTPPELQGRPFHGIVRSPNHDAFGLAVIMFQLLFMGRHPFSGQYLGAGEMPIDRAIRELRFAYGASAGARQMRQPPGTLSLEAVSQPVAKMFERAFLQQARPKAQEWITALSELGQNLKQCARNSGHSYLKTLVTCPWCEAESNLGVVLFNVAFTTTGAHPTTFNITAIWAQITSVRPPEPTPALLDRTTLDAQPSPPVVQSSRARMVRAWVSTGAIILATALVLLTIDSGVVAFWFILLVGIGAAVFNSAKGKSSKVQQDVANAKQEAERRWRDVEQRWRGQADTGRFQAKLRELEAKKRDYQNLPTVRQRKLQQLDKERWERQQQRFLDTFRISDAKISGIGPSRKMTLYSFGVETAADVTDQALSRVPGFGPTYRAKLLTWRRVIEQQFVFDPKQGINPADTQAVEQEIVTTRTRLEREIQNGSVELQQISQQVKATRDVLHSAMDHAARALAQAEADWRALPKAAALAPVYITMGVALLFALPLRYAGGRDTRSTGLLSANSSSAAASPTPQSSNVNAGASLADQQAAKAKVLYTQGLKLTKANKYAEAAKVYQQAVALKPDMAEAQHELGYALYRLGKYQESIAAAKQAISLNPNNADTYRNLGQDYEALGNWREAYSAFQSAVKLAPNDATSYYNLGLVLRRLQDNAQALEAYRKTVRLKPDYAAAHYELGMLYLVAGDRASAMNEYTVLSSLNQKLAEKLNTAITGQNTETGGDNDNQGNEQ